VEIAGADELRTARVDFGGVVRPACLAYVPEAQVGDYVLVHVGFAISRIDEDVARETYAALAALGALEVPEESDAPR
jgi:hydrogenase expression/formation protein HypC